MKPKISGINSEEYSAGRIDHFIIEMGENLQIPFMNLFKELGFEKDKVNDLDIDYPSTRGYFFFCSKKIKAHFFIEKSRINLILDNKLEKKKLIQIIEKYFSIFKE